jgi:hypothetical protein
MRFAPPGCLTRQRQKSDTCSDEFLDLNHSSTAPVRSRVSYPTVASSLFTDARLQSDLHLSSLRERYRQQAERGCSLCEEAETDPPSPESLAGKEKGRSASHALPASTVASPHSSAPCREGKKEARLRRRLAGKEKRKLSFVGALPGRRIESNCFPLVQPHTNIGSNRSKIGTVSGTKGS